MEELEIVEEISRKTKASRIKPVIRMLKELSGKRDFMEREDKDLKEMKKSKEVRRRTHIFTSRRRD